MHRREAEKKCRMRPLKSALMWMKMYRIQMLSFCKSNTHSFLLSSPINCKPFLEIHSQNIAIYLSYHSTVVHPLLYNCHSHSVHTFRMIWFVEVHVEIVQRENVHVRACFRLLSALTDYTHIQSSEYSFFFKTLLHIQKRANEVDACVSLGVYEFLLVCTIMVKIHFCFNFNEHITCSDSLNL